MSSRGTGPVYTKAGVRKRGGRKMPFSQQQTYAAMHFGPKVEPVADPILSVCDSCALPRPDVRPVGRDADGEADAPDLCGECRERL